MIAEKTLAGVDSPDVRLPLRIDQVRMDLDKNGTATEDESLYVILQYFRDPSRQVSGNLPAINITFDLADAIWMRGYCHVMSGFGETILAYDLKDQFERTAHLFYPRVDTPYEYLVAEGSGMFEGFSPENIADLIALIHTINYECTEPDRMQVALAHFETMIQLSRQSFAALNAETDDDHEWVPNPKQKSSPVGIQVRPEMQKNWNDFLNEAELVLQGKKLLPFHRGVPGGNAALFFGQIENAASIRNWASMFAKCLPTPSDLTWFSGFRAPASSIPRKKDPGPAGPHGVPSSVSSTATSCSSRSGSIECKLLFVAFCSAAGAFLSRSERRHWAAAFRSPGDCCPRWEADRIGTWNPFWTTLRLLAEARLT